MSSTYVVVFFFISGKVHGQLRRIRNESSQLKDATITGIPCQHSKVSFKFIKIDPVAKTCEAAVRKQHFKVIIRPTYTNRQPKPLLSLSLSSQVRIGNFTHLHSVELFRRFRPSLLSS